MKHEVEEAQRLLQPMLDLFGGADGGVAFAKLRHGFLPDIIRVHTEKSTQTSEDFLRMVEQFSRLCQLMLDQSKKG
jgi:hypothetical protein